jgi:hypothetical protein
VNLVAQELAKAARHWFRRFRQTDDLSRLVIAAAGTSVQLSRDEIKDLRTLLEKDQTWGLLAGGKQNELKAKELFDQIARCLPPRDGRTADDGLVAARAIACGLVEFAVCKLDSETFQKVVLARLQQMSDQASALDQALFGMHKDLYHQVDGAEGLFQVVMDRLPPGRADLNEVKIYLRTLIEWLNRDPWPTDRRLHGPALTPADIERKLRVSVKGPAGDQDIDADELTRQCSRLVILGGPGSGKTWLAMRTARICAEEALRALETGTALDEVELPLYTACSRLAGERGNIRDAAAAAAIERIGDLGGSRIIKSLCLFFTERRNEPTLLVIDSLDEARDAGEASDRLREVDSLRPPWRVVLTGRRSSWNNQLNLEEANQTHRVGDLQPLRYPDDVQSVIQQWFADKRQHGEALAAQIANRPSLQQAATVPLILAFYCILAGDRIPIGDRPLPTFRRKLYEQVINALLHSPWRRGGNRPPDLNACQAALRTWAWPGSAENHHVSGVGDWKDDIPTEDAQLSPAGQAAVDQIAVPSDLPSFGTDETLRRFVHRSIREYLVADYVAHLPADQAIAELLPHLWYDPDWEYTAPAAIAMHPKHDEVLQALLCRAGGSDEIPGDLSVIDTGGQGRRLLARIAAESKEDDWSRELKLIIDHARVQLAQSGIVSELGEAAYWPVSNHHVRAALLERLADAPVGREAPLLAATLAQLDPAPGERRRALDTLLSQLADATDSWIAAWLAVALVQLGPESEDEQQARQALLALLSGGPSDRDAEFSGGPPDRDGGLSSGPGDGYGELASTLALLNPTPEEKRKARDALLGFLADPYNWFGDESVPHALVQLAHTPDDKRQAREALIKLLTSDVQTRVAERLASALAQLHPEPEDKRQARAALLGLLTSRAAVTSWLANTFGLANTIIDLAQTPDDKRQTLNMVFDLLAGEAADTVTAELTALVVQLDPEPTDKRKALDAVLTRLDQTPDDIEAVKLAALVVQLDPEPDDERRACGVVLALLTGQVVAASAASLAAAVLKLEPEPNEKSKARHALLALLTKHATGAVTDGQAALWLLADTIGSLGAELAGLIIQLDPPPDEQRKTLDALLTLLTAPATGSVAAGLASLAAQLHPAPGDERKARNVLLGLLADPDQGLYADSLAACLVQLGPEPDDERRARDGLLHVLARQVAGVLLTNRLTGVEAEQLAAGLMRLHPTPDDMRHARDALLDQLGGRLPGTVAEFVRVVLQLTPPEDKRQVLDALLGLVVRETNVSVAAELIRSVAQLDPTVSDLRTWTTWAAPPTYELFAVARGNSALEEWLEALPSLSPLSA